MACALCYVWSEIADNDTFVIQELVDGGVESWSAADLSEDWSGNANKRTALMGDCEHGARSLEKCLPLLWIGKGVDGLGV